MDKLSIIALQAEILDSIENAYTKAIKSSPRTVDAVNNFYKVLDETNNCRKALYEELELLKKED